MEFKSSLSKASTLLSQSGTSNGDSKDVYFAPEAMSDIQIVIDTKQDAKENLCLNLSSLDDDTKSAQSILITQFTDTEIKYEINDDGTQSCCVDAVRYHCHKQVHVCLLTDIFSVPFFRS